MWATHWAGCPQFHTIALGVKIQHTAVWVGEEGRPELLPHGGTALELDVPWAWLDQWPVLCKLKRWPRKIAWTKWRGCREGSLYLEVCFTHWVLWLYPVYTVKVETWPLLESSLWFFTLPFLYIIISWERVLVEWPLDGNLLFQAGWAHLLVACVLSF